MFLVGLFDLAIVGSASYAFGDVFAEDEADED